MMGTVQVPVPDLSGLTPNQQVRAAIYAAQAIGSRPGWIEWADRWCSGEDRSAAAAEEATRAALAPGWAEGSTYAAEMTRRQARCVAHYAAAAAAWRVAQRQLPEVAKAAATVLELVLMVSPFLDLKRIIARAVADEGEAA